MRINVAFSNPTRPEYGVVAIPFPLPKEDYDYNLELLDGLGIGDSVQRDCKVDEVYGAYPALKCLEGSVVNIDEMDYLAKRLDSFDRGEQAQFQAMASKLGLRDITDLINLTFSCQKATVITDFSDLERIGRDHFMNLNGGGSSSEELDNLDGTETALLLIEGGDGHVTPYGVVYSNGMQMERLYTKGAPFPYYRFENSTLELEMTSALKPYNSEKENDKTWLFLPMAEGQLRHALLRSGLVSMDDMRLRFSESELPTAVDAVLDIEHEGIMDLNRLAEVVQSLSESDRMKLGAAVEIAKPETASEITQLAINLPQFVFYPGVDSAEAYGKYMIQESGRFEFDSALEDFYDYARYGQQRLDHESGQFVDGGYIVYEGDLSLDELMMQDPVEQDQQMGGMSM